MSDIKSFEEVRFQEDLNSLRQEIAAVRASIKERDDQYTSMLQLLNEIKILLTGTMGSDGMVVKIKDLEKVVLEHDKKIIWASGFAACGGAALAMLLKKFGL